MLFIATLKHSPENCLARPENKGAAKAIQEHFKDLDKLQKETGVKLHGSYVCHEEHTFYYILETDDYSGVRKFFGNDMLMWHTAKITPVNELKPTRQD